MGCGSGAPDTATLAPLLQVGIQSDQPAISVLVMELVYIPGLNPGKLRVRLPPSTPLWLPRGPRFDPSIRFGRVASIRGLRGSRLT